MFHFNSLFYRRKLAMMSCSKILFFLLCLFTLISGSQGNTFWIRTKVTNLEFNNACLSKSCFLNGLKFRIQHSMEAHDEFTLEWPSQKFISEKTFTSEWNSGEPNNVQTHLQVINYDPTYGFPRVCDSSPKTSLIEIQKANESADSQTFELRGNCFNVTLEISKHGLYPGWPEHIATSDSQIRNEALWERLSDPLYFWPIAIISFLGLIIFFLLLIMVCVFASRGSTKASVTSSKNQLIDNSLSSGSGTYFHPATAYMRHMMPQGPVPQKPITIETNHPDHFYETLNGTIQNGYYPPQQQQPWSPITSSEQLNTSYVSTPSASIIDV